MGQGLHIVEGELVPGLADNFHYSPWHGLGVAEAGVLNPYTSRFALQALEEGLGKGKASFFTTCGEVYSLQGMGLPQVCDTVITFYLLLCSQVFVFNLLSSIYYLFSEGRFSWCLDCIGKCCDQSGFTASATLASTPPSRWMRASSWISSSSLNRSPRLGTWPHSIGSIVGIGRQQELSLQELLSNIIILFSSTKHQLN